MIIIIIIISFMQGIYTHIPDTNYVPRECSVAATLLLLLLLLLLAGRVHMACFTASQDSRQHIEC
jgi:hypothetical protein